MVPSLAAVLAAQADSLVELNLFEPTAVGFEQHLNSHHLQQQRCKKNHSTTIKRISAIPNLAAPAVSDCALYQARRQQRQQQ